jgi:signal transduction histidine kinase
MASLGGLVAGITHDVNTPLGVGVTAASFLQERLNNLKTSFEEKSLTTKNMENFINEAEQTANLLLTNLNRASELIASFKQVAVDQTSETEREINLNDYIRDIIKSLKPSFKHNNHEIVVSCPEDLYIRCAPGAIAQIVTNMIVNSLVHGFEDTNDGKITLDVSTDNNTIEMRYRDNGKGLSNDDLDKLFDAFFTTKRGEGGSGLGTHIMYNLVTQSLSGHIEAQSKPGDGLQYTIRFPMKGKQA